MWEFTPEYAAVADMELSELQACTTMESRATHQGPTGFRLSTVICSVSMPSHPENVTFVAEQGLKLPQVTLW